MTEPKLNELEAIHWLDSFYYAHKKLMGEISKTPARAMDDLRIIVREYYRLRRKLEQHGAWGAMK